MQSRTNTRSRFKDLGDTADVTNQKKCSPKWKGELFAHRTAYKAETLGKKEHAYNSMQLLDYWVYFIIYISNDGAKAEKLLDT